MDQEDLREVGEQCATGVVVDILGLCAFTKKIKSQVEPVKQESGEQIESECKELHEELNIVKLLLFVVLPSVDSDLVDAVTKKDATHDLEDSRT